MNSKYWITVYDCAGDYCEVGDLTWEEVVYWYPITLATHTPNNRIVVVSNQDKADLDCLSGLTDEEQEILVDIEIETRKNMLGGTYEL